MSSCRDKGKGHPARNRLDALVRHFRANRSQAQKEASFYANQPSLAEAIETAALCKRSDGKRHSHQRRLLVYVLWQAKTVLLAVKADLQKCKDFETLHNYVAKTIGDIYGIGELTIYDISHRLAMFLEFEPDRVYLHRGTRQGARALGLGKGKETILVSELPKPLRSLKAWAIEDFLCIYKDQLGQLG